MTWILPGAEILQGVRIAEVRHVVRASPIERVILYGKPNKGKKWRAGPKGRAWLAKNRSRRNQYQRDYYYRNHEQRRAYLSQKQREYREARKG